MAAKSKSLWNIVSFNTAHKLQVMSHSVKHFCEMVRLVAHGKELDIKSLYQQYETFYMQSLSLKGTVKKC